VAETCSGINTSCPADGFQLNGMPCDDGNPTTCGDQCTVGVCAGSPAAC